MKKADAFFHFLNHFVFLLRLVRRKRAGAPSSPKGDYIMLECGCLSANVAPPLLLSRLMIGLEMKVGICQALLVHAVVRFIFTPLVMVLLEELIFIWDHHRTCRPFVSSNKPAM